MPINDDVIFPFDLNCASEKLNSAETFFYRIQQCIREGVQTRELQEDK